MPVPPNWARNLAEVIEQWRSATEPAETYRYLTDPPYEHFFLTEAAESWDGFLQWAGELRGYWCFRGQREAKWFLNTSLDRAVIVEHKSEHSEGYYHLPRPPIERDLLFRFRQQAHNWVPEVPSDDDLCSWLGMMQHHGVPTRLLDWARPFTTWQAEEFRNTDADHRLLRSVGNDRHVTVASQLHFPQTDFGASG